MHGGQGPIATTNRSTDGINNHDFTHVGILCRFARIFREKSETNCDISSTFLFRLGGTMSQDRSAGVLQDDLEALARRVEELNTELVAVRRELREQRLQSTGFLASVAREELGPESIEPSSVTSLAGDQPEMSRRHALRAAGVLAAGAVAGGAGIIAAATPAAAATGTFDGGSPAVTANGGSGTGSVGVNAQVQGTNGVAVDAFSSGTDGVGVRGNGDLFGVYGISTNGTGVSGDTMGQFGIFGNSAGGTSSAGVYGRSMNGRGLHG
jgi:hypothetical protein